MRRAGRVRHGREAAGPDRVELVKHMHGAVLWPNIFREGAHAPRPFLFPAMVLVRTGAALSERARDISLPGGIGSRATLERHADRSGSV
eukprot:4390363-Pyramimonas_sp.AAC.1